MTTVAHVPMRIVGALLVLGSVWGGLHSGQAQPTPSVRVSAQADPTTVEVGASVRFIVRVDGAPATVVRTPDPPATTNLEPQQRTPRTRQIRSSTRDGLRQGVVFSWRFRPQQQGVARIQPLTVVVQGEVYTIAPIRIQVTAANDRSSAPTLTRPDGGAPDGALDARDLFVRARATDDRAYQNEQVIVEYSLFYRPGLRLRHSRLAGSWDAPGFWREELNVASRPTPQRRRAYGRTYETVVLKRVALFPTRPGTLRVDPLRIETEAQGTMRMRQGGPSIRGRFEPVKLASQSVSLDVRGLPAGAPPGFDGAVGQFSMAVEAEPDSASVGDPVTLTVQVEGTGNLATLSPPVLNLPSGLQSYEPTVETDIERNESEIRGTKTFTHTLVPQSAGRYDLSSVAFSYFDPDAGRYETLRAEAPTVHVSGAAAPRTVGRTGDGLPVNDVAEVGEDRRAQWVRTGRRALYQQPWAYLALLLPLLIVGGGAAYRRWGESAASTPEATPAPVSDTEPDRLQEARRHLREGSDAAVYDAVGRALRRLLAERLGRDGPNDVTRAVLDQQLPRHEIPAALQEALYEVLDRCDEAQYAPSAASAAPNEVVDDAHAVLRGLEARLPRPEETDARS